MLFLVESYAMKIVIIGGTGQIGSKLVARLAGSGHEILVAAPETGVNIISGAGLAEALEGARVVVDVTNKIAMDRKSAVEFFETAARNISAAEIAAGVQHHIALSVLNSERLSESGYIAGKLAQEEQVRLGSVPYTIVHAAQFFELVPMMVQLNEVDGIARLPHVLFQPVAAQEVADTLAERAVSAPVNGSYKIAGPEAFRIDELAARYMRETGGTTQILADPDGTYFGAPLSEETLLPGQDAHIRWTSFDKWLGEQPASAAA